MASGNVLAVFFPSDNEPPSSNYATLDTRNGVACLDFDGGGGTSEEAHFAGFMPDSYSGGNITVTICWTMTTWVTTKTCRWEAYFSRFQDDVDSVDSHAFGAANAVSDVSASAAGEFSYATITASTLDSIAAGEYFRLKIARNSAHADDDFTTDAELYSVTLTQA